MDDCKLNEGDLERLLFDILPRFPNVHTLDIENNNIESFQGIEDRIKKLNRISSSSSSPPQKVVPDNKLRKLNLAWNDVTWKVSNNPHVKARQDRKEEAALITILDAFNGICYWIRVTIRSRLLLSL